MIVSADPSRGDELEETVTAGGWLPLRAADPATAIRLFREAPPDLVIVDFASGFGAELDLLDELRAEIHGERVPIVSMVPTHDRRLIIDAFAHQADDVVEGRPHPSELIARFRTRISRRPLPRHELLQDPITGALTPPAFEEQLERELERVTRGGGRGALGYLTLEELPGIEAENGSRARDEIVGQIVQVIEQDSRTLDFVGFSNGVVGLLLPGTSQKGALVRFQRLGRLIYEHDFNLRGRRIRLTPVLGFTESVPGLTVEEFRSQAWTAMAVQAEQRDLHPTRWRSTMSTEPGHPLDLQRGRLIGYGRRSRSSCSSCCCSVCPLAAYLQLYAIGIDVSTVVYLVILLALLITSVLIAAES